MRTTKLRAKTVRKLRVTTDSNHKEPVAENLLSQNFRVVVPNDVWVSDISYIRTRRGWQYLTVILDLFNREVVGRLISSTLPFIQIEAVNMPAVYSGTSSPPTG